MSDLIYPESFNLYVGDAGPDNSKHLIIENLKVPDLEELSAQLHAGGSWGAIEVGGLGMKELMCSFKLMGWDAQTLSQFGINSRVMYPFTAYGNARSKATGDAIALKWVMFGRLTSIKRPELKRGEVVKTDHEVREILHFEEWIGAQQKYLFDWNGSQWLVDGQAQNADEIQNLAIPAAAGASSGGATSA